jgi:hypothetical protein
MITRLSSMAFSVALAFGAGSAWAAPARVGPIDRTNGYPQWYQDKTGLTLDFCQNQTQAELTGGWRVLLPPEVPGGAPETFRRERLEGREYRNVILTRGYPRADDHERRLVRPWLPRLKR